MFYIVAVFPPSLFYTPLGHGGTLKKNLDALGFVVVAEKKKKKKCILAKRATVAESSPFNIAQI